MKLHWMIALCALAVSTLLLREITFHQVSGVYIRICSVGQGDATVVRTPNGKHIVIDGGPNNDVLSDLGEVLPWFTRTIDLLVLTHPDLDHVHALPEILKRHRVQQVLLTGIEGNSGRYTEFLHELHKQGISLLNTATTKNVVVDGVQLRVLWPKEELFGQVSAVPNDTSTVLMLEYNGQRMLLTGDIGSEAEAGILASGRDIRATYLKVPHHGSITSSSTGFLLAVAPAMGIVSAGVDNKFGHPHAAIVERYRSLNIPLWSTATQGDFHVLLR
jgi:competence protein ComEC